MDKKLFITLPTDDKLFGVIEGGLKVGDRVYPAKINVDDVDDVDDVDKIIKMRRAVLLLPGSFQMSIIWGDTNYGSNHNAPNDEFTETPAEVEIAIIGPDGNLFPWSSWGADTVHGWSSTDFVNTIVDMVVNTVVRFMSNEL